MRIKANMIVPPGTRDDDAIPLPCLEEKGAITFHVPQKVMVFSAGGARSMKLWACENHPFPEIVTDDPLTT